MSATLPIHYSQRTGFISDPPPQLLLSRWVEGRLKQSGLLEELLALLFGVEPVGGGTSQVEDASSAMEGTVEQVQDGA